MKNSVLLVMFGIAMIGVVPAQANTGFDFTQCTSGASGQPNSYGTGLNYYGNAQTQNSSCNTAGYSNTSNQFSQTVTGIGTVTATAYTTATGSGDKPNAGTAITSGTNAYVGQYTGNGIGVCSIGDSGFNSGTPSAGCNQPDHQVDNGSTYEF